MPDHTTSTLPDSISLEDSRQIDKLDNVDFDRTMRELNEWIKNDVLLEKHPLQPSTGHLQPASSPTNKNCVGIATSGKPLNPTNGESSKATAPIPRLIFPALPIDNSPLTHDGLVSRAVELARQFREEKDYGTVRKEFVEVSLALNQFKLFAPVFRDQPKMPFKRTEWKRFTQLLIDQIVIDLHWLHCRGEKLNPIWPELQALLAPSSKFDCDAIAVRLAAKNWSSDFRVNELIFVNDRQQRQLMQLRSKALKETFRSVLDGKGKPDKADGRVAANVAAVRMAIVNWADRTHQIRGHEDMYESLWVARKLLGAKASYDDIGELAALRCGKPSLDRKTVAGKLKTLDAKLKEEGVA